MTVEELKVRLCEEIKFNNDGYNNMCEVLEEFSEAQKTAHNSEYMSALNVIEEYKQNTPENVRSCLGVECFAKQRLNQRSWLRIVAERCMEYFGGWNDRQRKNLYCL